MASRLAILHLFIFSIINKNYGAAYRERSFLPLATSCHQQRVCGIQRPNLYPCIVLCASRWRRLAFAQGTPYHRLCARANFRLSDRGQQYYGSFIALLLDKRDSSLCTFLYLLFLKPWVVYQ
jgi:hypothetical protein